MLITEYDFDRLSYTSCNWNEELTSQEDRFENVTEGCESDSLPPAGGMAYWLDGGWATVILATNFLCVRGYRYHVLADLRDDDAVDYLVLVTDYRSIHWQ